MQGVRDLVDTIFTKLPILFLGVGMLLLMWVKAPTENHDIPIGIISGLLGIVTGRATASLTPTTIGPVSDQEKVSP